VPPPATATLAQSWSMLRSTNAPQLRFCSRRSPAASAQIIRFRRPSGLAYVGSGAPVTHVMQAIKHVTRSIRQDNPWQAHLEARVGETWLWREPAHPRSRRIKS
jgi:hypothetical protein